MGCLPRLRRKDKVAVASEHESAIQKSLDEADAAAKSAVKLLLLGAGESGKSTLFKQMKVINKDGYADHERAPYQSIVWNNVIDAVNSLMGAFDKFGLTQPPAVAEQAEDFARATAAKPILTPELGATMRSLLSSDVVQQVLERRSEYNLSDSAEYYFGAIERIADPDYLPTTDDVVRSRVRTTGIVQTEFTIKSTSFVMFDVGGQRAERRKWIHTFDDVNAVCFVAAASEFDQVLFEDATQNRLDEALTLFKQVVNSKWFRGMPIILFLNKMDLFEKKISAGKKLSDSYPAYEGKNAPDECIEFIVDLFLAQCKKADTAVYVHKTTATDPYNVKFVFDAVQEIILKENMKQASLE